MPSAEGAIPEDYAKVAEAREHLGLGEERPRAELGSRLPTPTQHLRAAKVASPAVGCCRWSAFHSCDARSMQRLTHAHGSTLDPPGSSLVWLDKHDGCRAEMKHSDFTSTLDVNLWFEAMFADGHVAVLDSGDRDSTDDDRADHDDSDATLRCCIDADGDAPVAREEHRDVTLADRVDRKEITRERTDDFDLARNGCMHAVVVTRAQVNDGKLAAFVTMRIDWIANEIEGGVVTPFDLERAVSLDGTERFDASIGRTHDRIGFVADGSRPVTQRTREEFVEAREASIRLHGFVHVDAISSRKRADDCGGNGRGKR